MSLSKKSLLFKIDVEGYEEQVLKGMRKTIKKCKESIGCMEFDESYLQQAGTDISRFLTFLGKHFHIYFLKGRHTLLPFYPVNHQNLRSLFGEEPIHTDMILIFDKHLLSILELKVER